MKFPRCALPMLLGLIVLLIAGGCGGSGSSRGIGGNTQLSETQVEGTARFEVDVDSGEVSVVSLDTAATSRAIFGGTAISFQSSDLLVDSGELTRRVLQVRLRNNTGERINPGFRVLFSKFTNKNGLQTDQRGTTNVTTFAGSGSGSSDGPALSAGIGSPKAMVGNGSGGVFFASSDGRIRLASKGAVSTVATGVGDVEGLAMGNSPEGVPGVYACDATGNRILFINPETSAVRVVAGSGSAGSMDGNGTSATFNWPSGILNIGGTPNQFLITENASGKVRVMEVSSGGVNVSTAPVTLNGPSGIAQVKPGVYVTAEPQRFQLKLFALDGATITLGTGTAGTNSGPANAASFTNPSAVCTKDGSIFVVDGYRIRQVSLRPGATVTSPANWVVATVAGSGVKGYLDGIGTSAMFGTPGSLLVDTAGNLVVGDSGNSRLRMVTPTNGKFPLDLEPAASTALDSVRLANASDYTVTSNGNDPFIQEFPAEAVGIGEEIDLSNWSLIVPTGVKSFEFTVTVEARTDTLAPTTAVLNPGPSVAVGSPNVVVRTLAGTQNPGFANGNLSASAFADVVDTCSDASGNIFVVETSNATVRRIATDGRVTTIAGRSGVFPVVDGIGTAARFGILSGIACTADGTEIFVTDGGSQQVRRLALQKDSAGSYLDPGEAKNWLVSTVAGETGTVGFVDSSGLNARFNVPWGIAITSGGDLLVTERLGRRVRKLTFVGDDPTLASHWAVSTLAGDTSALSPPVLSSGGQIEAGRFGEPKGIAIAPSGEAYVTDAMWHQVRKVMPSGAASFFAGVSAGGYGDSDTGTLAKFNKPVDVSVDASGYLYVVDSNFLVRRISPAGAVRTVAGTGAAGFLDGFGSTAQFQVLNSVEVTRSGDLVVGDQHRLRLVQRLISQGK